VRGQFAVERLVRECRCRCLRIPRGKHVEHAAP
jgi:hypothetical protein